MKRIKKLSVMLLCCLLLSVIAMPVSASAAKLNKKSISLNVGKTYTLKASGTKGKITWTSSKKSVATVSSKGVVKAKKKGTAVITAKYGKSKLTCKVTVKQPVTSIKLNKTSATLKKGSSLTLKAAVAPSSANNKTVTWSSSNKKVATVSSKGVVKAVGNGTATITVKAKDGSGKKATCKITVGTQNSAPAKKDPSSYFKTVELNTNNFSKYFTIETLKNYDEFGEENGGIVYIKCKDPNWYLLTVENFAAQIEGIIEYTDENNIRSSRNAKLIASLQGGSNNFYWDKQYHDVNITKIECTRAQGTLVFIDKSAVKKIQSHHDYQIKMDLVIYFEYINSDIYKYCNEHYNHPIHPSYTLQPFATQK